MTQWEILFRLWQKLKGKVFHILYTVFDAISPTFLPLKRWGHCNSKWDLYTGRAYMRINNFFLRKRGDLGGACIMANTVTNASRFALSGFLYFQCARLLPYDENVFCGLSTHFKISIHQKYSANFISIDVTFWSDMTHYFFFRWSSQIFNWMRISRIIHMNCDLS